MPADLLFEIGVEEIPAGFVTAMLPELERRLAAKLEGVRLAPTRIETLGAPRRLTAIASGVPDRQPDLEERVIGPPVSAAYKDGQPTRAAEGFAAKNGVELSALETGPAPGKKGEYVQCTRHEPGRPAAEVLPDLLAELVAELPWPKSMRWGWVEQAFARPIHWFVAKLGGAVLPFEFADVRSGGSSRGHRFLAPGPVDVGGDRASYESALRAAFVVVDPGKRRAMVEAELRRIEGETHAVVRPDSGLVDEVVQLVEYPVGVSGSFDAAFLEVPEEVVVSAMRSHQRYFAMEDRDGTLINRFVTISGTVVADADVVRYGNEKVIASRLSDARFFFHEDRKRSLERWGEKLAGVVFQAKLGTIADKVARMRKIAVALAERVGADAAAAARVCDLCKADLVTRMVGEFPDLQGTMGRYYAQLSGEAAPVCLAIEEHYLPRGAQGALPTGDLGAVVGIADRIDTLVGCFAAGLSPSGSADPYGLRRAALAILSILLARDWSLPLRELIELAAAEMNSRIAVTDAARSELAEFFRTRLRGLIGQGAELPADCIEAALAAGADDVPDVRRRAEAVAQLRRRPDFEPLASAFKRVANILKDQKRSGDPDPKLFADAENDLWTVFLAKEDLVGSHLRSGDYGAALSELAELKAPVDRFFDTVLVMDEDPKVRDNRLALLGRINATFNQIADFRQLAV